MTYKTVKAGDAMAVAFDDCPEGLFWFDNTLCFMSEYATATESWRGFRQRDAYVVSSGEYFWGGASTAEDRAKLMVRPISYPEAYLSALPHARVSECDPDACKAHIEAFMHRALKAEAALSSQHAEAVPVARSEDDMPERIWAGDFNASGFGHCVAGPQGGLYAEYVRADLASPVPADAEPGIKALLWTSTHDGDWLRAESLGLVYEIRNDEVADYKKAQCQADYEARIRSALHTTPTPVGVVEYRLLDSADTIQADDEFIGDDGVSWESPSGWAIGARYSHLFKSGRRALRSPAVEGK